MRKRDEPAFPVNSDVNPAGVSAGLTKLEYTAIQAMQGLLANKADGPIIKQAMSFAIVLWDELEKTDER